MPGPDIDLEKYLPENARISRDHEYHIPSKDDPKVGLVGITNFAVYELGDVTFVKLPTKGQELKQFEEMGEINSVKAFADLFSPVTGKVLQINEELAMHPELVISAANEADEKGGILGVRGWMLVVELTDPNELDNLMTPETYAEYLKGLEPH